MEDIRKTGPVGLKGVNITSTQNTDDNIKIPALYLGRTPQSYGMGQDISFTSSTGNLGASAFDEDILTLEQVQDVENMRAMNEPTYLKWVNGITKGAVLTGTTFLDGTVGLIYGLTDVLANIGNKNETGLETFSRLWDNEFSNGMRKINEWSETVMPNYRTTEEREGRWWENLGTANFWADTFLKNLGFTVGALYSGKAFNSLLKSAGWLNSGLGAAVSGVTYSAINEARIEANHNANDFYKLETQKLQNDYAKAYNEIVNNGTNIDEINSGIESLNTTYNSLLKDLESRKAKMGLTTWIGNTIVLTLTDFITMGRLYAKGFETAKTANKAVVKGGKKTSVKEEVSRLFGSDQNLAKRVGGKVGERTFTPVSNWEMAGRGLAKGLLEGNEEMAQRFTASSAGEWFNNDSPDAYYEALINQKSNIETSEFLDSITKGFAESYGNGDAYEEFAVGFLTGILGTPTFGRVHNADASTYFGRGKIIGLTGGIFGEFSMGRQANADMQEAIDYINKYEKKLLETKDHFVRTQSFTKAMDGWAEEGNKFEFKNSEDNDTFSVISRYATLGKLNWLRDLINQDFENISDETLMAIARETSTDVSGWKNADGAYTPDGVQGAKKMKDSLSKKRDELLEDIDAFEKSLNYVQGIANQSISKDEASELAWYHWKISKFEKRFKGLLKETKGLEALIKGFNSWEKALLDERFELTEDKDGEVFKDNTQHLKFVRTFKNLLEQIRNENVSISGLAKYLNDNKEILEVLENEAMFEMYADTYKVKYDDYMQDINNLKDISKMALAYDTFNERLKEFSKNPLKLKDNRSKIEDKEKAKTNVLEKDKKKQVVKNASVSELVKQVKEGTITKDDLHELSELDSIDTDVLDKLEAQDEDSIANKVEKVEEILDKYEAAKDELDRRFRDGNIDQQALNDAIVILESGIDSVETPEDLLDPNIEHMLDAASLETLPEEADLEKVEREDSKNKRLDKVRELLNDIEDKLSKEKKPTKATEDNTPKGETGKDSTPKVQTEQAKLKENEQEQPSLITEFDRSLFEVVKKHVPKAFWTQSFKDVKSVYNDVVLLLQKKLSKEEITATVTQTQAYKTISTIPALKEFLRDSLSNLAKSDKVSKIVITKEVDGEVDNNMSPNQVFDFNDSTRESYRDSADSGIVNGVKQYWTLSTTRYPIHKEKGDERPYYEVAKKLKTKEGTPLYTEAQLKRMEAVHKYLDRVGAFALRDSGSVKINSEVRFIVDPSLNEEAGEIVILMTDENGNIIGDLPSKSNSTTNSFVDLLEFINRTEKAFLEAQEGVQKGEVWMSDEKTTVRQNLVGSVHFDKEFNSVKDVFTDQNGNPIKPIIGVVLSDHSISTTSENKAYNDPISANAIKPLKLSPGKPVILIKTGVQNRSHIAIPFATAYYNIITSKKGLGKIIEGVLNDIPNIKTQEDAIKVTKAIKEHLGRVWKVVTTNDKGETKEISVGSFEFKLSYTQKVTSTNAELSSGIVLKETVPQIRITYKPDSKSATALDATYDLNDPNLVQNLKVELYKLDIPFRINRKYLNKEYNGVDYNSLISEISHTNIVKGAVTTINNWFTINPIKPDGTIRKGSIIKTMGIGKSIRVGSFITIEYKGKKYIVDTVKWTLSDESGKYYTGIKSLRVLGEAFGIHNNLDGKVPYDTPWGKFDPIAKDFIYEEEVETFSSGDQQVEVKTKRIINTKDGNKVIESKVENRDGYIDVYIRPTKYDEGVDIEFAKLPSDVQKQLQNENTGASFISGRIASVVVRPDGTISYTGEGEWSNGSGSFMFETKTNLLPNIITIKNSPESTTKTKDDLLKEVKNLGLLNTPKRIKMFNLLNEAQLSQFLYYSEIIRNNILEQLERNFNNSKGEFKKDIDTLLKPMFRTATVSAYKVFDKTAEIKWLEKVLPQYKDRVSLVEGLIKISEASNSERAWGRFYNSTIILSDIAARGTTYHEAFHAVVNTILSEKEHKDLFEEAKKLYGVMDDIALEEKLAEDFRKYVQTEELFMGNIVKIFRKLKHFVLSFLRKESVISKVFYNINNGKYKSRTIAESNSDLDRVVDKNNTNSLNYTDEYRDRDEYDEIEDYHERKYMFNNLNLDDRSFVLSSGFNIEDWNKLHKEHKEAVLMCK